MSLANRLKRYGFDTYILLLFGTVLLAVVLPASGIGADVVRIASMIGVALLFFLYGAKLDTTSVVSGLANWRVQLLILGTTFVLFPIAGLGLAFVVSPWLDPPLVVGLLFLAILPSTVQSSIAFTALAQGNVAAAVCAASLSNLIGVVLTPLLAALLLQTAGGGFSFNSVISIAIQILLPFVVGQLARPLIGSWVARNRKLTLVVDRGAILLIVYTAFSAGVIAGVWYQVETATLGIMAVAVIVLLTAIMLATRWAARAAQLPEADQYAVLFCGSTKSLASGVPIAAILFAGQSVSLIILPLMLFHQLQLFACAVIAQRRSAALLAAPAAAVQ